MDSCSIHQIRGQIGEGNDARSGREFQWHNHAFGKEDTAKELRLHAAETQDTWVDAAENTEVTEIEHAVCRALNELRAATTKGFDIKLRTIRLERIDHEQVAEKHRQRRERRRKRIDGCDDGS